MGYVVVVRYFLIYAVMILVQLGGASMFILMMLCAVLVANGG
jgi:hypothetical protein